MSAKGRQKVKKASVDRAGLEPVTPQLKVRHKSTQILQKPSWREVYDFTSKIILVSYSSVADMSAIMELTL